jgi:hypothetical protein
MAVKKNDLLILKVVMFAEYHFRYTAVINYSRKSFMVQSKINYWPTITPFFFVCEAKDEKSRQTETSGLNYKLFVERLGRT